MLSNHQLRSLLIVSELGLATHYAQSESLQRLVGEISQLPYPTFTSLSGLLSSHSPPTVQPTDINSKSNPNGTTVIKGDIRDFLDRTFRLKSIKQIYEKLQKAENDESLSSEVKVWAKEQQGYMDARSPTGMAVALEGYRRARQAKRLDITLKNGQSFGFCTTQS